ncbi:MAG: helix-hairpin-helix domain-containing protein [Chitinophagaceae bacterium]|nr:helix-hairpin-helix domain-containing protein [Chitinophagaceae bacterium]
MKLTESLREYFTFSRKERVGVIVILLLITGVFFLPKASRLFTSASKPVSDTAWMNRVARLEEKPVPGENSQPQRPSRHYSDDNYGNYREASAAGGELFYFDPNTLTDDDWKRLGLREKTAKTILNYVSKGGRFRKPEDLKRIYGLFPDEYERLAPYIRIAGNEEKDITSYPYPPKTTATEPPAQPRYAVVEINTADTTAFISLPGIGSKLASRIINFRDKLGGFYAVEQVKETYGLPDSTFQKIKQYLKAEPSQIRKININTATAEELKTHPYIRWQLAKTIIAYRNEHGHFYQPGDLKKVITVTDEIFKKIEPYLEFTN